MELKQNDADFEEHSLWVSIAYHLLPGIVAGLVYFLAVPYVRAWGYPNVIALILAGALVLTPVELGILLFQSRKEEQRMFKGFLAYLQPLPLSQYLIWVPIIIVSTGLIITLFNPLTDLLQGLFKWMPDLDMGLSGAYDRPVLILTYFWVLVFVVLILPIVEEFYFRGFLLPRMPKKLKAWAPLIHSFLFAIYHTWTPWMAVSRTAGLLPLVYIVRWKQNLWLGVIAHCLLNSIDFFIGLAFILSL